MYGIIMSNYLDLSLQSNRIKLIPASLIYTEEICTEFTTEITKYMWPSAPKTAPLQKRFNLQNLKFWADLNCID